MTDRQKVSILDLKKKKSKGEPLKMMTAYDYPGAILVDESEVDIILVGDSLAMTVLGHPDTVSVTMDEMLHHCKAVARGAKRAFLVGDMPFMSYQADKSEAVRNAGRFMKEARMDAVKMEGGDEIATTVKAIVNAGISVMGHLGLTPQSATQLGGYRVQGKTAESAAKLLQDALSLQDQGCFAIVLEAVPTELAALVSRKLTIPTIGIGAGPDCDGQVLVLHDILGLFDGFAPKFLKQYANLRPKILAALEQYCGDVDARRFPAPEHCFDGNEPSLQAFLSEFK